MADASTSSSAPTPGTALATSGDGTTVINDSVIAKITGVAVRRVPGVFALGGGAARALGALRDAVGSSGHGQGVSVEVGKTQVAADITIVVEYPMALQEVADAVRAAAHSAITELVGMEVTEINVTVTDVHIPGEDQDDDARSESRVR